MQGSMAVKIDGFRIGAVRQKQLQIENSGSQKHVGTEPTMNQSLHLPPRRQDVPEKPPQTREFLRRRPRR